VAYGRGIRVVGTGDGWRLLLIYHEFREKDTTQRVAAFYGFLLMAIGGVGVILVGIFPENTISYMHVAVLDWQSVR